MKLIAKNKKALFEYEVLERMEAGISLKGSEVKSIKSGNVSLKESFVTLRGSEAWVLNMHVSIWKTNDENTYQETRERKLLLSKKELAQIYKHTRLKGNTIAVLDIHLVRGLVKLQIALVRGKKRFDKRQTLKEKDEKRQIERDLKEMGY